MLITQLIYIKPGAENIFDEFESIAIPLIGKFNGKLLLRVRPDESAYIEKNIEAPYEIHLVEFVTAEDFKNFMHCEERKQFLHLKEAALRSSLLIQGEYL